MENCNAFTTWRIGGSVRKQPRRDAVNRPRGKSYSATAATAMEKPLGGKVQNQTFPPSLQIAQKTRDSHFPTAATTAGLGLHSPCLDGRPQGYILKWLDAPGLPTNCFCGYRNWGTARAATAAPLSLIHISEPTRLGMISYAVFCLKKKKTPPSPHGSSTRTAKRY